MYDAKDSLFSDPKEQVAIKKESQEPPQPSNILNPDLLKVLHSELEANPEVKSLPKFDTLFQEYLQSQFSKDLDEEEIENQMADEKRLWRDLLDREQNFHDKDEWNIPEDNLFLAEFEGLYKSLENEVPKLSRDSGLQLIYSRTYNFLVGLDFAFAIFARNTSLYQTIFDVCMFMGLSMFLHNTKRIRGVPFSQYVYAHSCIGFSDKNSTSYIEHNGAWKQGERTAALDSHETTMRQFRHRLFKSRPVDNRRPEWSAIPKSSEHEWQLYFDYVDADGKADPQLRDTLKRIKNLYNGVNTAIHSSKDAGYKKRLEDACDAFSLQFMLFSASFIWLSRLLIDKLVEDGYLGENWEALFLEGINSLATRVLYDPTSIDYSVKPGTQEAFEMLLTVQVKAVVKSHIMDWHYNSKQKNTEK